MEGEEDRSQFRVGRFRLLLERSRDSNKLKQRVEKHTPLVTSPMVPLCFYLFYTRNEGLFSLRRYMDLGSKTSLTGRDPTEMTWTQTGNVLTVPHQSPKCKRRDPLGAFL